MLKWLDKLGLMRAFVWRWFKKGIIVQVALTLLLASAVTVFAIYSSFISRESKDMGARIENNNPAGYFLVTQPDSSANRSYGTEVYNRIHNFLASWYVDRTPTNYGKLPIVYVDTTYGMLRAKNNVAAVHENIARRLGLQVGDELVLYRDTEPLAVSVTEIYTNAPLGLRIEFGEGILVHTGQPQLNQYFLYERIGGWAARDTQVRLQLANMHGRKSTVRALEEADPMGTMIVKSNYNVINQAKVTLLMFLALAFLTAKLLAYMDTRRVLAILKALGLRNRQVSLTILGEAILSPLFGSLLGGGLAIVVLRALNSSGHNMSVSPGIIIPAMLMVFPAVALGTWVPARLAQVSSVNELLFERQVALFSERVSSVRQIYPALEPLTSKGAHLLKLNTVEGVFNGFVFHRLGDEVQVGEVLALEQRWWGLKVVEYVTPVAGTIDYFEEYTGMVAIMPTQ